MKWLANILVVIALLGAAAAQSTTLTATVTDSDGQTWNNGMYYLTLIPNPQYASSTYSWQGQQIPTTGVYLTGALDGTGTINASIPDNNFIRPAGSKWSITVQPYASAGQSFYVTPITGTTLDLSSALSAASVAPRFSPDQFAHGYLDVEVSTPRNGGGTYFNVTTLCLKVWTGVAWVCPTDMGGTINFSAGDLNPLFTSHVTGSGTHTIGLSFSLDNAGSNTIFGDWTNSSGGPIFNSVLSGGSCGDSSHAVGWTAGLGFTCQAISGIAGLVSCENWYSLYGCNANYPSTTSDVTPTPYVQDVDTVAGGPPPNTFGLPWVTNVNTTCHDSSGTLSTYACSMPNATHKGDTVGFIVVTDSGGGISLPTDSQSNTYTALYNTGSFGLFYAKNVKDGNNTVTMHLGSNGGFVVMPFEIIGADPTSPILVDGGQDNSCTGQNPNFNSVTIGQNATIVGITVGYGIAHSGFSVYSTGSGYFLPGQYAIDGGGGLGQSRSIAIEWQAFTSLGAHTPSMTANANCSTQTYVIAVKLSSTGTPQALVVAPSRFTQGYLAQPTSPDLGVADAYVVNAGGALAAGTCPPTLVPEQSYVWFLPANANATTTPTLNWCSLGAQTITKNGHSALVANDLITTKIAHLWWDGTFWQLDDPATTTNTIASGTATMGTSAIASGACASTVTVSAPGTTTSGIGSHIIATPSVDPQTKTGYAVNASGSLYILAFPTADHVNFEVCNNTAGSITPAALTLNWSVQ